jgi:hypothetical protein
VNEYLGMLLDGNAAKWELRAYAGAVALVGFVLKFAFDRFIRKYDAAQKVRHADHVRLGQHEAEIVDKLRDGSPFPDLTKEE